MKKHIKDICKIGQGHDCCRYLMVSAKGFECAKLSRSAELFDARVAKKSTVARGDNCDGYVQDEPINFPDHE